MTAPLSGTARYTLAGEPGTWRYIGQATYVDDDDREVEHDYVRMTEVGGDREVWVPLSDVTGVAVDDDGRRGVFALGLGTIAG